jgi:hypothetical protein
MLSHHQSLTTPHDRSHRYELYITIWNVGTAFVATQSAQTGELQLRAAKIPELVASGPPLNLQLSSRESLLAAVKEQHKNG